MAASDSLKALEQAERVLAVVKHERDQLDLRIAHLEQVIADLRASIESAEATPVAAVPVPTPPPRSAGFSDIVVHALGVAQKMRDNPESEKVITECLRAAQKFHDAHAKPAPRASV